MPRLRLDPLSPTGASIVTEITKIEQRGGGHGWLQSNTIGTGGSGGVTDGDKGDITVSGSGAVWTIDTGLDAAKLANGSVSNSEFQFLDGVTSAIQTQLNTKQGTITLTTTGSSGAATLIANTLNIPQYSGGGTGITRSVNNVSTTTAAGSTASTDYAYFCTGTFTVTLPTAVGNTNRYTVKNVSTGTITIATTSAQTIDGSATASLPVQNTSLDLISDGTNWNVV